MANPTTNYSFAMPTNTDLVKDLPADFEVFGQAVDTQMKTNADAAIAKSLVTTKGDLIAATAASTPARLAIGANDTVLTADSTTATGVAWKTAASPLPSQTGNSGKYLTTDGTNASWGTVATGGMTLLSTTTLSGTATTISSISGSYTNLFIMISGVNQSANGGLIINPNGASNLTTWVNVDNTGGAGGGGSSTLVSLPLTGSQSDLLASQTDNSFACQINNYASAASVKTFQSYGRFRKAATPTYAAVMASGGIATSSAISSIQITTTAGSATHSAGTVLIYGVK